jgi:hypothetical protein
MRRILVTLTLFLLPILLQPVALCQNQVASAQQPDPAATPKPDVKASTDVAAEPAASSTLYFYRPRLYRGGAVRIGIFVDGKMAVNLVNGRWASIQLPAGHHVIKPKDDQSGIEIDMEPGQSYYVRSGWGEQGLFHGAHKQLMLMMKEQAAYEIKQLKPLDEKDVAWTSAKPAEATH